MIKSDFGSVEFSDGKYQLLVLSESDLETQGLGQLLAPLLPRGRFIGLSGELGAGKTEFARGIAAYYGVSSLISSPTYVLENIYPAAGVTISHWDLYRLASGSSDGLDIFDHLDNDSVVVLVEWPGKVAEVEDLLEIEIMIDFGRFGEEELTSREILIRSANAKLIEQLADLIEG